MTAGDRAPRFWIPPVSTDLVDVDELAPMRPALGPCAECPGALARLARAGRIVAGLASLAAAAWWTARAVLTWWRTRPAVDAEFGLRFSPLTPADAAAARARESALDSVVRL